MQFAAVSIGSNGRKTAAVVRAHGWRIPVAYDRDGAIGALYGVAVCPMVELAYRGGRVAERLIGSKWADRRALEPEVRKLRANPTGRVPRG